MKTLEIRYNTYYEGYYVGHIATYYHLVNGECRILSINDFGYNYFMNCLVIIKHMFKIMPNEITIFVKSYRKASHIEFYV